MKQYITIEQLLDLSEEKQTILYDWANKRGYLMDREPLLSIGQMIEFLDEHDKRFLEDDDRYEEGWHPWRINDANVMMWWGSNMEEDPAIELCDALWEACKEVLEV